MASMRRPDGFSLIECMVAAVLCAAGVLALAGSARALLDLALLGHRTAGAAEVASARLATLRGVACAGGSGAGSSASGAIDERWASTGTGRTRSATVDVAFVLGGRTHRARYQATFRCPP